jgi:hypothetical protein
MNAFMVLSDVEWFLLKEGDLVLSEAGERGSISKLYASHDGGQNIITIRWTFGSGQGLLSSGAHKFWDRTNWLGLGIEFNEDGNALSITRNDCEYVFSRY